MDLFRFVEMRPRGIPQCLDGEQGLQRHPHLEHLARVEKSQAANDDAAMGVLSD
jgi:hypothetical protein